MEQKHDVTSDVPIEKVTAPPSDEPSNSKNGITSDKVANPLLKVQKSFVDRLHDSLELYRTDESKQVFQKYYKSSTKKNKDCESSDDSDYDYEVDNSVILNKQRYKTLHDKARINSNNNNFNINNNVLSNGKEEDDDEDDDDLLKNSNDDDDDEFEDVHNNNFENEDFWDHTNIKSVCSELSKEEEEEDDFFQDQEIDENDEDEDEDENADESNEDEDEDEEESDNEDGFVFDSNEEEEIKSIPSPFWFANEDQEQLKIIFNSYYNALNLDEERKRCIREPVPFVGRILRTKVENKDSFTTLDEVEVYRRCILAPGSPMPLKKTHTLVTTWSYEDGIPTNFIKLNHTTKLFWLAKKETIKPSYVLCLPVYDSATDYNYFVTPEKVQVTYSPLSPMISSRTWYHDVIPENINNKMQVNESEVEERIKPNIDLDNAEQFSWSS